MQKDEIILHLFQDNKSNYELRKDVLYKYFNTFKLLGLNVVKENKLFSLEKAPISINFSQKEIEGMKLLLEYANAIYSQNSKAEIQNLIKNLCNCSQNCSFENLKNSSDNEKKLKNLIPYKHNPNLLNKFRLLCKEKQKISFSYFNQHLNQKQKFKVEPEETIVTPVGCILKAYNPDIGESQNFYIEAIEDLNQLPVMSKPINAKTTVIFALKGRLAAAYELKQGEKITKKETNYLVVTNSEEDKDLLIKRLLRYGKACEILYPKAFRKKVLSELEKILQNYQ